jgi:rod shape determining protein RodA
VGSGLLTGRGFMQSIQSKLNFLPERHTDFIFSVVGEEWGFAGSVVILLLYAWLVFASLSIARRAKDVFGEVVAVGIAVMFGTHIILNVGMAVGLLPIIGLPLPLLSYGGSSLLTSCIALGILQSIHARSMA